MNTDSIRNSRRHKPNDLANQHLADIETLYQRAFFTQRVISNTVRKMPHYYQPGSLGWASSRHAEVFVLGFNKAGGKGIPRDQNEYHSPSEILADGPLTEADYLVIGVSTYGSVTRGYVPIRLLKNDPVGIAMWVRATIREADAQWRVTERATLGRMISTALRRPRGDAAEQAAHLEDLHAQLAALDVLPKGKRVRKPRQVASA